MACEFRMVMLHNAPELTQETAELLNSEWPRSIEARCQSIKYSSDNLPCSLVLLRTSTLSLGNTEQKVIGFGRLSRVLGKPKSLLVESVVICQSLRGCGFGKTIMKHIEDISLKLGYECIHLSTYSKQSFYEHLGYSVSSPVSAETKVSKYAIPSCAQLSTQVEKSDCLIKDKHNNSAINRKAETKLNYTPSTVSIPFEGVPIPPPPPLLKQKPSDNRNHVWMKKELIKNGIPPQ